MTGPMLPRATEAPHTGGVPLLGSALSLLRDPYRWWARQYQAHGPVFRLTLPIEGRTWIAIAGAEANALLAREGHRLFSQKMTYPKAEKVLGTDLHPSITEGQLQRHLRSQVAPGFSRHAAAPHLPAMTRWVRERVDGWRPEQRFRVAEEMSRLGLNCVSLFATGTELGPHTEPLRHYATVFTGVIAMSWPMAVMRLPYVRRTREGLDALIEERLAHHRRVPPGAARAPDYFDFLLGGTLPEGEPLPERVRVVFGQIPFKNMGVYAGRVINHVLYQLVTRPDVLARVQPEIDRVLADDEVTLEELASMQAMRATIMETLRVLPIAVALQRTVCEPFELGGYRFAVGDRLFVPISVTHWLPEYFPDPHVFDIDRYLPERSEQRQPHVYTPFGVGHHSCVARGLFEAITSLVVGVVLHRWRLEAPYRLRTIVDALPGPWPGHRMRVLSRRAIAPPIGRRRSAVLASPTELLSLPPELLDAIDASPERALADGQVLFEEGDPADAVYFVREGDLQVTRRGDDGAAVPLAVAGPGEVVGEVGILQGVPRTATVVARGPARVLAMDGDILRRAVIAADLTARELVQLAVRRHAGATLAAILGRDPHEMLARAGAIGELRAEPGEVLLRRGDRPDRFYLLVEGAVDILIERPDGAALPLARLVAPDCFGEIGMLHGRPRTATARVCSSSPARLLTLDRAAFRALLRDGPAREALTLLAEERVVEAARGEDP